MYLDNKISWIGIILVFLAYYVEGVIRDKRFDEKIKNAETRQISYHFEVRYSKILYLFYVFLSIPLSFIISANLTYMSNTIGLTRGMALIIGGFFINFIYKSLILIVYDQGEITYYFAGIQRVRGNVNQLDMEYTASDYYGKVVSSKVHNSCIAFSKKERIIFYPENMTNGDKLVCMIKRQTARQEKQRIDQLEY